MLIVLVKATLKMESLKMDKKNPMAHYQQSFRIDDLLTRKANEQQPGHFCPPLHPPPHGSNLHPPPPPSNLHPPPPGNSLHSPPPGLPGLEQLDKPVANLTCQANGKVTSYTIISQQQSEIKSVH